MLKTADILEAFIIRVGRSAAWLTLFMVLLTVVVVIGRYFFDFGRIWMQELVTWSHAAVFLLGAAYTLARDEHVRVDVFYHHFSAATRAWVNIAGTVLLMFPICIFLAQAVFGYALKSWRMAERSPETGGLPYPLIPLAKTLMLVMVVLLMVQGVVIILRNVAALYTGRYPDTAKHKDQL